MVERIDVKQMTMMDSPAINFGSTYAEVLKQEKDRGFTIVEKQNKGQILATKKNDMATTEFVYYFDKKGVYKLLESHISNKNALQVITTLLVNNYKLIENTSSTVNNTVRLFNNDKYAVATYEIDSRYGFIIGEKDDSNNSWTRQNTLQDNATNIWMPTLGQFAPQITMEIFEYAQGHTINNELTKKDNGVFVFNTNSPRFPHVKYWFDITEKSFLEETAIFIDKDNRPTPVELNSWLNKLGFKQTISVDNNNNPLYFNEENKCIALLEMNQPSNNTTFEPKVQFFFGDLTDKLPAENIQMPMPILTFNTYTMAEAVEEYKKESYYVSSTPHDYGMLINTNSEEFKSILIMEDGGKYAMAFLLAETVQVINSPEIPEILIQNGFEEKNVGAIPTFINKSTDVMAQIDKTGAFGSYSVAFSKNEF